MDVMWQQPSTALKVSIAGFGLIGRLESAVDEAFASHGSIPAELIFDFSEVTFLELPTLHYVIALALARKREGLGTSLKLPDGDDGRDARDFLRRWKFQTAVNKVLEMPLRMFVVPEDLRYFQRFGGDRGVTKYSEPKRVAHRDKAEDDSHSLVTQCGLYVASRIVFEAMTNAVRHPGATYIQTSSRMVIGSKLPSRRTREPLFFPFTTWALKEYAEAARVADEALDIWSVEPVLSILDRCLRKGGESDDAEADKQFFSVTFWDDGQPIADTLARAMASGLRIREDDYPAFETNYRLRFRDELGATQHELVSSMETPNTTTPGHRILLAALFPGITCDISGKGHRVHAELQEAEPAMARYGMGLFSLIRTAVDEFGGSVAFRTGPYFMNIKSANKSDHHANYRVKIECKPKTTPVFQGNMVTIRLPMRNT